MGGLALTRHYVETISERMVSQSCFTHAVLVEAATLFLNGEVATARLILRDMVNAMAGFDTLAKEMAKPSESLRRMLSKHGNASMDNFALIFGAVCDELGVVIEAGAVTTT